MVDEMEREERLRRLEAAAAELGSEEPELLEVVAHYAEVLYRDGRTRVAKRRLIPVP